MRRLRQLPRFWSLVFARVTRELKRSLAIERELNDVAEAEFNLRILSSIRLVWHLSEFGSTLQANVSAASLLLRWLE